MKQSPLPLVLPTYLLHANVSRLAPQLVNLRLSYFSSFFSIIQIMLLLSVLWEVQIGLSFLVRQNSAADFLLSGWIKALHFKWVKKCSAWLGNTGWEPLAYWRTRIAVLQLVFPVALFMISELGGSQYAYWWTRRKKNLSCSFPCKVYCTQDKIEHLFLIINRYMETWNSLGWKGPAMSRHTLH